MTGIQQAFLQSRYKVSKYFYGIEFCVSEVNAPYPLHYHDFYEMEFVISGSGEQWINGQKKTMRSNCLYILTPSDLHRIEVEEELIIYNIKLIDPELISHLADLLQPLSCGLFIALDSENGAHVRFMLEQIRSVFNDRHLSDAIYVHALLTAIVGFLINNAHHETNSLFPSPTVNRLMSALQYIQKNHTEPLQLQEAAAYVGLSPCHFSTMFTQWVGCHFIEYLNNCRLLHAQRLLIESDRSIAEISYAAGFGCLSQFMRCFKKSFGISPMQMRRQGSSRLAPPV